MIRFATASVCPLPTECGAGVIQCRIVVRLGDSRFDCGAAAPCLELMRVLPCNLMTKRQMRMKALFLHQARRQACTRFAGRACFASMIRRLAGLFPRPLPEPWSAKEGARTAARVPGGTHGIRYSHALTVGSPVHERSEKGTTPMKRSSIVELGGFERKGARCRPLSDEQRRRCARVRGGVFRCRPHRKE